MTLSHEHAQDCQRFHRHGHTRVEGAPANTDASGNCCSPGQVARSWVVAMVDRVTDTMQLVCNRVSEKQGKMGKYV